MIKNIKYDIETEGYTCSICSFFKYKDDNDKKGYCYRFVNSSFGITNPPREKSDDECCEEFQ